MLRYFKFIGHIYVPILKIEFMNISMLIPLRTKKVTKWVLGVHMFREQVRVNQQIHLCQIVLALQSLMPSMYLFPKYNYYFRYYVVGGYYFVIIIMKISPNQVLFHSWYLID